MTDLDYVGSDGLGLVAAIRARRVSARAVTEAALARVASRGVAVNAFTDVLADRARADADRVDGALAAGHDPGPLAGVPFAAKNLFDVAGVTTLAGSRINADRPPATHDATAVARLRAAGAVLVGALNMDEYAYGLTTENTHYGPTRNPHDPSRIAGGSSWGSAPAVAAGFRATDARHRHQRLDPRPRRPLRRVRAQADVRTRLTCGRGPARMVVRPRRAPDAPGPGPRRR